MKKLLSVLLALSMLLTLTAPALADPAATDEWAYEYVISEEVQAWLDAHPQAVREFHANIDAYLAEEWPWFTSVSEMAEDWGESEDYILSFLTEEWALAQMEQEEWEAWKAAYEAAHPGTQANLETNAYDYFAREYPWYNSAEEYMADFGYTEEEFIAAMVAEQLYELQAQEERAARLAEFEAAHPGSLAALEANAYDYFDQEYLWYDSPEEYMASYGYTQQEFVAAMVDEQINDILIREENLNQLNRLKADLGGVPGQIGVMLNGAYIAFPDAVPEITDGRTMVPYRALMEALGGDVDYDGTTQTVSCILDDVTLKLTVGETTLTIDKDGTISTFEMDCAPYIKDDRTYVPVRFISQAFGYEVLWDQGFQTAVLMDEQALAGEIDSQFTILNRALKALLPDPDQAQELTSNMDAKLTLFDTISGDRTFAFSAIEQSHTLGAGGQAEVHLDLSALKDMVDLKALLAGGPDYELTEEESALVEQLLGSLGDLSVEMIVNGEAGDIYLRSPLLGLVDASFADAWLVWHGGEELTGWEDLSVGTLCCQIARAEASGSFDPDWIYSYLDYAPVLVYANALTGSQALAEVLGDNCFTHTDTGDVFTLDPAVLGLDGSYYNPFSQLEFTFTVADSGAITGSFTVGVSADSLSWLTGWDPTVLLVTGSFDLGESRRTLIMDLHMKNTFRLELDAVDEIAPTSSAPLTAPPEGAVVIDIEEGLSDLGI